MPKCDTLWHTQMLYSLRGSFYAAGTSYSWVSAQLLTGFVTLGFILTLSDQLCTICFCWNYLWLISAWQLQFWQKELESCHFWCSSSHWQLNHPWVLHTCSDRGLNLRQLLQKSPSDKHDALYQTVMCPKCITVSCFLLWLQCNAHVLLAPRGQLISKSKPHIFSLQPL